MKVLGNRSIKLLIPEENITNERIEMDRYKKPQVYVINNSRIANKLSEKYIVSEGDLGLIKKIEYGKTENDRYVNLEYNLVSNLHEYEVRIIDMQEMQKEEILRLNDEKPVGKDLYKISFPKIYFDPRPLVAKIVQNYTDGSNLTIFFAGCDFEEEYKIVEVQGQNYYSYPAEVKVRSNWLLQAGTLNKQGKKFQNIDHKLSTIISKYATEYKVIFNLPKKYQGIGTLIENENFIPLLTNQNGEVVSYIGFDSETGYELALPVCKNKDQLVEELLSQGLPEIMPEIFPEAQEFNWIKSAYYKPTKVLQLEESIKQFKREHQERIKIIEGQIQEVKEENKFLTDLLTESGDKLVVAVAKYFLWLGFGNVILADEKESGVLREDIQIVLEEYLFIIEVKGLRGTSTDSECAQIGKHRRRREKEHRDKEIYPIYIVNHQRYTEPNQRSNPPFSKDQIDYAQNDERGLLTTWDMYKKYKLIESDIFTKEEVRQAFYKHGLLDLTPADIQMIGKVNEYYPEPRACILELDDMKVRVGDEIICNKDDIWLKGKVESLKVNDKCTDSAQNGEIGLVLDIKLGKGYFLYKRCK